MEPFAEGFGEALVEFVPEFIGVFCLNFMCLFFAAFSLCKMLFHGIACALFLALVFVFPALTVYAYALGNLFKHKTKK